MKKYFSLITFLLFSYNTFSLTDEEEIASLKKQIALLQQKVKVLEKKKEKKKIPKQLKVGLVLSGGGAKGFAHIGVLKVLEENNIKIDCITGTSMGALIGALYSVGYSPDEIEKLILDNNWQTALNDSPNFEDIPIEQKNIMKNYNLSLKFDDSLNFSLPKSLKNTQNLYLTLKKLLWKVENIKNFNNLPIPLRIIATDLNTGKAVAFSSGDLAKVVTASISIPTIFDPVKIGDSYYVDGLISRNFPVEDAFNMGANVVIGVDVGTSLKKKNKYDILSVADQIFAIQSSSSTKKERELANILITPDVKNFKSTDFNDYKEIEKLGEIAAQKELNKILKLNLQQVKKNKPKVVNSNTIFINNLVINNSNHKEIISSIFKPYMRTEISTEKLENIMSKVYSLSFVNKFYYSYDKNTLYLTIEENPTNIIGVGFDYQTDYGSIFSIGTNINSFGKIGSLSTLEAKVGDYAGVEFKNFSYYGLSNKIGILTKLSYNEEPFLLYNGKHKIGSYKSHTSRLESSIVTQYSNLFLLSYGASLNYTSLKPEINSIFDSEIEYSKSFGDIFWSLKWDKTDSPIFPTTGTKGIVSQKWGVHTGPDNLNFFTTTYSISNYIPITDKLSITNKFFGGNVSGEDVLSDKYIKLGGMSDDINNNVFAFEGYYYQQKYVSTLFGASLGLQQELFKNLYLDFNFNTATYKLVDPYLTDEHNIELWKDYKYGYGVGLNYLSLIGPLRISISQNPDSKDVLFQFSFGYKFK